MSYKCSFIQFNADKKCMMQSLKLLHKNEHSKFTFTIKHYG